MQLSPTTSHQPPLWGPVLDGTYLGTAVGTPDDPDGTALVYPLKAGERVGAPDGYASLEDALTAIEQLTKPEHVGAAAIVVRDDRYYAAAVDAKDGYDPRAGSRWVAFEPNDGAHDVAGDWYLSTYKHAEQAGVVAIVDGDLAVYDRRNA